MVFMGPLQLEILYDSIVYFISPEQMEGHFTGLSILENC